MDPRPVGRAPRPRYPTREAVLADPDLLVRHLPHGFRLTRELAAATSLFLAAGALACSSEAQPPAGGGDPATGPAKQAVALVAPIFEHGSGRGVIGCVVSNPPVFLSEEEALQVIREELAAAGIEFTERNVPVEGVAFPERYKNHQQDESGNWTETVEDVPGRVHPFAADAVAPGPGVTVEFVSRTDFGKLGGASDMSTVQGYDLRSVAAELRDTMEQTGKGGKVFGTFYDPMEGRGHFDREKREYVKDQTKSIEALKQQVKGFVDWLKAQGAI